MIEENRSEDFFMIGENIKKLRINAGLTQKDLAEKLFVTAQAVSRWENNDVEPSATTIYEMAKIFNVSIDEIFGNGVTNNVKREVVVEKEIVYTEPKPAIAVCSQCGKVIYDKGDLYNATASNKSTVICKDCFTIRTLTRGHGTATRNNVSRGTTSNKVNSEVEKCNTNIPRPNNTVNSTSRKRPSIFKKILEFFNLACGVICLLTALAILIICIIAGVDAGAVGDNMLIFTGVGVLFAIAPLPSAIVSFLAFRSLRRAITKSEIIAISIVTIIFASPITGILMLCLTERDFN